MLRAFFLFTVVLPFLSPVAWGQPTLTNLPPVVPLKYGISGSMLADPQIRGQAQVLVNAALNFVKSQPPMNRDHLWRSTKPHNLESVQVIFTDSASEPARSIFSKLSVATDAGITFTDSASNPNKKGANLFILWDRMIL